MTMLKNVLLVIKWKKQYISWSLVKELTRRWTHVLHKHAFINVISSMWKLLYNIKHWVLRRRVGDVWEENCLVHNCWNSCGSSVPVAQENFMLLTVKQAHVVPLWFLQETSQHGIGQLGMDPFPLHTGKWSPVAFGSPSALGPLPTS